MEITLAYYCELKMQEGLALSLACLFPVLFSPNDDNIVSFKGKAAVVVEMTLEITWTSVLYTSSEFVC
jgi:hypothetical protein